MPAGASKLRLESSPVGSSSAGSGGRSRAGSADIGPSATTSGYSSTPSTGEARLGATAGSTEAMSGCESDEDQSVHSMPSSERLAAVPA